SDALFDLDDPAQPAAPDDVEASIAQYRAQLAAAAADLRLRMLCHAESAGGIIAEELHAAGVPWDAQRHGEVLTEVLGARSPATGIPARMAELAAEVRGLLGDDRL